MGFISVHRYQGNMAWKRVLGLCTHVRTIHLPNCLQDGFCFKRAAVEPLSYNLHKPVVQRFAGQALKYFFLRSS